MCPNITFKTTTKRSKKHNSCDKLRIPHKLRKFNKKKNFYKHS